MSKEREEIEEELKKLRGDYYRPIDAEQDRRMLGFQAGVLGAGTAATITRQRMRKAKAKRAARAMDTTRFDVSSKLQPVPLTQTKPTIRGRAWGGLKKGGRALGGVSQFFSLPMLLARQAQMQVYNPRFGEQVNGKYFNYKKAAGQWTWLLIAIDLMLSFVPFLNLGSTLLDLTDLGASTIENALGDKNQTVSKYVDWVTALEQLLVNETYERWKEEMRNQGISQFSAKNEDIQKTFEQDVYKIKDEELLPEEWVKDRKDGKISDQLWKVILKLARGESARQDIRNLSKEDWKLLSEKYMIDTSKVSFITDTFDKFLKEAYNALKNEPHFQNFPDKLFQFTNANMLNYIAKMGPTERQNFFVNKIGKGSIYWNGVNVPMTGMRKYILYQIMQGEWDYLRRADDTDVKFFRDTLGIVVPEGGGQLQVTSAGEVTEEFYRQGQMKQKELLEPMWKDVERYSKRLGRLSTLGRVKQLEQQALNPDFVDPANELQYIYNTRINIFHGYVEQITSAKLNSDDPARGGNDYTETWIMGFYDPKTGKRYMFSQKVDAKDYWANPGAYTGNFADNVKNTLYIDDEGRGYTSKQERHEIESKQKEYEEGLGELTEARQAEIDIYLQSQRTRPFVREAGASLAGGAAVTGQYVSGGRASLAGGMRVQPSKK